MGLTIRPFTAGLWYAVKDLFGKAGASKRLLVQVLAYRNATGHLTA